MRSDVRAPAARERDRGSIFVMTVTNAAPRLPRRVWRDAQRRPMWTKLWKLGGVHVDGSMNSRHYIWGTGAHSNTTYSVHSTEKHSLR